ncbi:MAG: murein biosynthesis integral membrane protein MurJ [Deltaproteobacteria bacterium]|nr:MAG: murein biosynthesis integral membrane protein MurJ [Deltaproteobacteria bacterium]
MSENSRVTSAAGVISAATLCSRIFGYLRDMVFAGLFGAGPVSDAFIAAFRIPNMLRRLFGEGSLSISFIPVFTEFYTHNGKNEAFRLARSAIRLLSVLLAAAAVLGVVFSPWIVRTIAYGFSDSSVKFALAVDLTRIMFPYVFFIGMVALSMGILNVLGHFAAPALAPVFLNLAMIGSVVLVSQFSANPTTRVYGLAIGVVVGGVLQLMLQVPFLLKKGFYFWKRAKIYHPGLKKIGRLFFPATFGAAVLQINTLVGTLLASFQTEGSITYLYFADRLVQFPLALFGIATATAALPIFSRQMTAGDYAAVQDTFAYSLKLVFFITIPSMVGLIILREPIIALLFQRGAFDAEATRLTAYALLYYTIGLWAFSAVRIVVNAFYAMQDTKTPVRMAVVSISANLVLGIILMKPMGHGGLALALSLASMLNLGLLIRALRRRFATLGLRSILLSVCKTTLCSILMGFTVWAVATLVIPANDATSVDLLLGIMGSILIGMLVYGFFSYIVKSPELERVLTIALESMQKK